MAAPATGIQAYYRMEEATTGNRSDATGHTFTATDVNNSVAQAASGIQGAGCAFSGGINSGGTGQYLTIATGAFSALNFGFSVSCWVKPSNLNQGAKQLIWAFWQDATRYFQCAITTTGAIEFIGATASQTVTITSTTTITTGAFHHIVIAIQRGIAVLYVDNIFSGQINPNVSGGVWPAPSAWSAYNLFIGRPRTADTTSYYFVGSMDEFALYSRVLTAYDVDKLYNNASGISYSTLTGLTTDPLQTGFAGNYDRGRVAWRARSIRAGSLNEDPVPVSGQLVF